MIMGNFDIDFKKKYPNLEKLNSLCDTFSLMKLLVGHTCFMKSHKISIDLLLTTRKSSFQLTQATTAQKMKFSIKDYFSKCDQIRSFLRIWSHLLK